MEQINSKEWLSSLLSYFMNIKTIDDNIELLRVKLKDNNIQNSLFNYLDRDNKGFLLLKDFIQFLDEMKIPFEEKYVRKFIHNFDKDGDFSINFDEFLGLILPKKNIEKETEYDYDYKKNFGKLLCEELELVKNCIKTAKFCQTSLGFTCYEGFLEITKGNSYITEKNLYEFLKSNNININNKDMHQLMFRLDADNDGNISFTEFKEIFFPTDEDNNIINKEEIENKENKFSIKSINNNEDKKNNNNKNNFNYKSKTIYSKTKKIIKENKTIINKLEYKFNNEQKNDVVMNKTSNDYTENNYKYNIPKIKIESEQNFSSFPTKNKPETLYYDYSTYSNDDAQNKVKNNRRLNYNHNDNDIKIKNQS